jgi:muconolactone delta-isomerase
MGRTFDRGEAAPMQFLAIARRRVEDFSESQIAELLPAEAERVRELYAAGVMRTIYTRADVPGAVVLLEAGDLPAAQAAMESLPLYAAGMLEVQIIPLRPFRGFAGA